MMESRENELSICRDSSPDVHHAQTLEASPEPPIIGALTLRQIMRIRITEPCERGNGMPLAKWLPKYLSALWDVTDGDSKNRPIAHGKDERSLRIILIRNLVQAGLVRGRVDSHEYLCHHDHDQAAQVIEAILEAVFRGDQIS